MKKQLTRCYRLFVDGPGTFNSEIYLVGGGGYGFELATCTSCGEVFVLNREDPGIRSRSLTDLVPLTLCPKCGTELRVSLSPYPETFVARDGSLGSYVSSRVPPDAESLVREMWSLEAGDWGPDRR